MSCKHFWRKYHKWGGIILAFFMIIFCLSGIILNHRSLFTHAEISRKYLPENYKFENYNNGIIKGTIAINKKQILAYGSNGIWLTDHKLTNIEPFNNGLENGTDNRHICNLVKMRNGKIVCAGLYDAYMLTGNTWRKINIQKKAHYDRIADITAKGDSLIILTRNEIFISENFNPFTRYTLPTPDGYSNKVSLFKTIWQLHSGALFGIAGRIFVDLIAGITILLCITGIAETVCKSNIKRRHRRLKKAKGWISAMVKSVKIHYKVGTSLFVFFLITTISGTCLRPPLMVPLVLVKTSPVPLTSLDNCNVFFDKLRAIRWDESIAKWIISTSDGFYQTDLMNDKPQKMRNAPEVSPMGINCFSHTNNDTWLIGSFSGLSEWNTKTGAVRQIMGKTTGHMPIADVAVAGYSADIYDGTVFDYFKGALSKHPVRPMKKEMTYLPLSLWNTALEVHTGRIFEFLLGPLSVLYIFIFGTAIILVFVSGWKIHKM